MELYCPHTIVQSKRYRHQDPLRVEVRGGPGATTGQERVPNAAYAVLQRCPAEIRMLDPIVVCWKSCIQHHPTSSNIIQPSHIHTIPRITHPQDPEFMMIHVLVAPSLSPSVSGFKHPTNMDYIYIYKHTHVCVCVLLIMTFS